MPEISTSTTVNPAKLDERVAQLRAKLPTTPQGRKVMQALSPVGMVKTERNSVDYTSRDIVDFTDWQQWSQWPQSY